MKLQHIFTAALLMTTCNGAPTKTDSSPDDGAMVVYTAEYDIIDILLPLNAINLDEEEDEGTVENNSIENADDKDMEIGLTENKTSIDSVEERKKTISPIIFFILADLKDNQTVNKGLYVRKHGIVTKLLDNTKGMAAEVETTIKTAYFATTDGVYSYNAKENKADKYGNITEDFNQIAKHKGGNILYVLNKDNDLYKITEFGTKMDKVSAVVGAKAMIMDNDNNLFYTIGKDVYVFDGHGVKKVDGLPVKYEYMKMTRPPYILESGLPIIIDGDVYIAYSNGTSIDSGVTVSLKTTAFSVEGTFIFYFAHDKKIYEYNFIAHLLNAMFDKFQQFVGNIYNGIRSFFFELK